MSTSVTQPKTTGGTGKNKKKKGKKKTKTESSVPVPLAQKSESKSRSGSVTICLNMIIKNESKVILRCFESLVKYIDYWVISDTGSTDGTQDLVKNYFAQHNIPGELHDEKWVNFGHNRSLSISLAKGKADYILLIDADHEFRVADLQWKAKDLTADIYLIRNEGNCDYSESRLVRGDITWCYRGVTHEYLDAANRSELKRVPFTGFSVHHHADGGSRSDKFERDVRLLTQGLIDEPNNERYMFYLGNSLRDLGRYDDAITYYRQRVEKGGWIEEAYYSQYQVGMCRKRKGDSFWDYMGDFLRAHTMLPERLEALFEVVDYCWKHGHHNLGATLGLMAVKNVYPKNHILFIDRGIHEWKFWDALAISCYYTEHKDIGKRISMKLVRERLFPKSEDERIRKNHSFYK